MLLHAAVTRSGPTTGDLRRRRRERPHGCWDHLVVAPLWVTHEANLGTLLRTCDAVGACMAVPKTAHYLGALSKGDTLRHRPHLHYVTGSKLRWVERQRERGSRVVAVVETPMVGTGPLNVAVAGSLVLCRLAGLA